ncbi:pollen-specific leucine-rich repeat extensin-like protein 2 [Panicum miliaceum]|uniref:Pollen-specific leucine-rich repeat extensin-like protein 2 n=1 Tax=Panicum miliaceum TaxID=4540 RepID=A0A3L6T7V3_PANMI|nr:pollen-specific leucine-rich repeat extensin-like protein 2 [Panicum miliaceum]
MASGEAEPLQYTTTVLRVSIHCEGCKKKVKKVLHNIEGVYKVTVAAAQHKVIVTGSVGADALVRRLHKAGKQAALWPAPAPAPVIEAAKKPEEVAPAPPAAAGEGDKVKEGADKADAKPKEAAMEDKKQPPESEGKEKKPEKDKGSDKKPEKAEAAKPKGEAKKDVEVTAAKEKASPEPAKESAAAAEEAGGEEPGSGKKGKKKKNKQKDGGVAEAAPAEKTPQPSVPAPAPAPAPALGPERPPGGFPYYAAQPVMSYNVAHPSSSVSCYAPTPVGPMAPIPTPPPPSQMTPYGYPPYPPMMPPPVPEFLYGPPGMRSSPTQESYNNMFNEENANSCSVM